MRLAIVIAVGDKERLPFCAPIDDLEGVLGLDEIPAPPAKPVPPGLEGRDLSGVGTFRGRGGVSDVRDGLDGRCGLEGRSSLPGPTNSMNSQTAFAISSASSLPDLGGRV